MSDLKQPTLPARLLAEKGISVRLVARAAEVDFHTAKRVLDPETAAGCRRVSAAAVRQRVEALLTAAGWDGAPDELWAEYDQAAA